MSSLLFLCVAVEMEESEEERHILHFFPAAENGKLRWKKKKRRNLSGRKFELRKEEEEEEEDEGPLTSTPAPQLRPENQTCEVGRRRPIPSRKMRFPPHRLKTWPTFLLITLVLFDGGKDICNTYIPSLSRI